MKKNKILKFTIKKDILKEKREALSYYYGKDRDYIDNEISLLLPNNNIFYNNTLIYSKRLKYLYKLKYKSMKKYIKKDKKLKYKYLFYSKLIQELTISEKQN